MLRRRLDFAVPLRFGLRYTDPLSAVKGGPCCLIHTASAAAQGWFSKARNEYLPAVDILSVNAPVFYSSPSSQYIICNSCFYTAINTICQAVYKTQTLYFVPVLPKPPEERSVSLSSSTGTSSPCVTSANTSCAILSPGSTTKSALPRFIRITLSSPL